MSEVAISGLVLGGGIGLSTRYLGLTCDSLINAEMVNAKEHRLTAIIPVCFGPCGEPGEEILALSLPLASP